MAQLVREIHSNPSLIEARVVHDRAGFESLRERWNELFKRAANATAPLSYDWLERWLDGYGSRYIQGPRGLRVICCWRGNELVSALPLYLRRPQTLADGGAHLGFVSTGEQISEEICPDYMDMLCVEELRDRCVELTWQTILHDLAGDYDRLQLKDIADYSPFVAWARKYGAHHDLQVVPRGVCPIADMAGGFEAYLSRLRSNSRQQARRLLRGAAQAGVSFEIATGEQQVQAFYAEMVELHQQRWQAAGEPGCFASEAFAKFHGSLTQQWACGGRAVLSRLRLGDQTLAVKYGFRVGRKFDFYQSGIRMDEQSSLRSPGIVSFLLLMKWLSEQGVEQFDFLRGSSEYKQRLATTVQPLVEVRRVMWTWRTGLGCVADLGTRCARKAGRLVMRAKPEEITHRGPEAKGE